MHSNIIDNTHKDVIEKLDMIIFLLCHINNTDINSISKLKREVEEKTRRIESRKQLNEKLDYELYFFNDIINARGRESIKNLLQSKFGTLDLTLRHLIQLDEKEIKQCDGVGKTSFKRIETRLNALGLCLGMDTSY